MASGDIQVSTARKMHAKKENVSIAYDMPGIFTNITYYFTSWLGFIISLSIW